MMLLKFFVLLISFQMIGETDFEKAEKLFNKHQYTEAKLLFEDFLKLNPNHVKTIEYLGDIAGKGKHWDTAIFYYGKLKGLKPQEANYYYKYGGVLGMKAKESNKFKALSLIGEVKGSFEKAIQLDSAHIPARFALIELYLQLPALVGGSETKAKKYANEIGVISPTEGHLAKGRIEEYFKRYKQAEKYYLLAISSGKSAIAQQRLSAVQKLIKN